MSSMISIILLVAVYLLLLPRLLQSKSVGHESDSDTLVLLHVLFRHGDRAPDLSEVYPNDPYAKVFESVGHGQLTKAGKRKEYLIGKFLRNKYDKFLGSYGPDVVVARSTDYDRTRMSCLLVLAGLFPPKGEDVVEDKVLWQPIPYDYKPYKYDKLMGNPSKYCKSFDTLYDQYMTSSKGLQYYKDNKHLYDYLSENTGWDIKTPNSLYNLYFVLKAEEEMGLKLPDWTGIVWPKNITLGGTDEYQIMTGTPRMKRITTGHLLKKILDFSYNKIKGKLSPHRKIFLYSGHESNVAFLLTALGVFYPHFPPFGCYVIVELHNVDGIYGIKILYQDYEISNAGPKVLKLPNCDEICPINKFKKNVEEYLPQHNDCEV